MSKGTYQNVTIVGNLGQDPEIRATASGTSVGNLNIAVTSYAGKDQSGQAIEHTEWFRTTVWGAIADNAGKYLNKGSKVLIVGEIRTRKWQDQNGQDRYTPELHARDMQFMGGGQGSSAPQHPQQGQQQQGGKLSQTPVSQQSQQQGGGGWPDDVDSDIPFAPLSGKVLNCI